jgi:hypothetical protein
MLDERFGVIDLVGVVANETLGGVVAREERTWPSWCAHRDVLPSGRARVGPEFTLLG